MNPLPTHIEILRFGDHDKLKPGQMLRTSDPKIFIKACPKCGKKMATGYAHTITEHDDGTITVRASCLCPHEGCDAHYFITQNRIEWC